MTGEQFVEDFIKRSPICVIAKSYCPYCIKLIEVLKSAAYEFIVENIDRHPNMEEIQDYCLKITGARSVPRVFVNGSCIGGCDDTISKLSDGSFKKLLEETTG
ncbi:glutaredoxin family protein [Cryptosporidium muris RN66]|uniref:Glutaredoxin family protein n=1 Tax=Cryptosporidium muris (strain RN66) TaxID=441375 RepID=B6AH80_CRYMR|nr:glutaredoxin family protein [Cryptosporidium muris RN66]EEA07571.1 glutaredoxin family protein [Cryptosporidium muris RN66]|eukprot:XP_002141920.1 glutaredoxin family protein [Cryptosporidium muris RN66]